MPDPAHDGCYDCGTREVPILIATTIPELSAGMTAALCPECRKKRKAGQR